jgi:hypothetical protein
MKPGYEDRKTTNRWITRAILFVIVLSVGAVFLWPFIRYSYDKNTTLGYTLRTDRLTGEKCLDSGPEDILRVLAVSRCKADDSAHRS